MADVFVRLARDAGEALTNLKLQPLLYYAQGWHLADHGVPLFDDAIEGWFGGPVVPAVWTAFGVEGWEPIPADPDVSGVPAAVREFVREIWDGYGPLTEFESGDMAARERPWLRSRRGLTDDTADGHTPLSHAVMAAFFRAERFLNEAQEAEDAAAARTPPGPAAAPAAVTAGPGHNGAFCRSGTFGPTRRSRLTPSGRSTSSPRSTGSGRSAG